MHFTLHTHIADRGNYALYFDLVTGDKQQTTNAMDFDVYIHQSCQAGPLNSDIAIVYSGLVLVAGVSCIISKSKTVSHFFSIVYYPLYHIMSISNI